MRSRLIVCLVAYLAAPAACQPDEFIPPNAGAGDGSVLDSAPDSSMGEPVDATPGDATPGDATPGDAAPLGDAGPAGDASAPDAASPTYTHGADIQPIWTASCASVSCHFFMATDAYDGIVGVPSSQVPTMNFVEPGAPQDSYLLHKLDHTHLGVGGSGEGMPPGPQLRPEIRDMIRVWIQEGAPR